MHGHFLKRTASVDILGLPLELDDRYARSVLDKTGMSQAKALVTPCSKISSNSRWRKGRDDPELK